MFKFIADIDEASPSEDEEAAQRALHGAEGGYVQPEGSVFKFIVNKKTQLMFIADRSEHVESGNARDILHDHRAKNRPNNAPDQQKLFNAARRQLRGTGNADVSDFDSNPDNNEDEEEGTQRMRARRHKQDEAGPRTAGHYPECWREAIDRAKEQFRRFIMLYNLFPSRDAHLQDATRILSKVIADERSNEKVFDPGKSLVSIIYGSNSSLYHRL